MPLNLLRELLTAGDGGGGRLHRGRQLLDDLLEQDLLVAFAQAAAGGVGRGLDEVGADEVDEVEHVEVDGVGGHVLLGQGARRVDGAVGLEEEGPVFGLAFSRLT